MKTMYSTDGDSFTFDSPEEALEDVWNESGPYAREHIIYQGEVNIKKASAYVTHYSVNAIIDSMEENAYDQLGEERKVWPNSTLEQITDLANRLKVLIDAWADEHGLQPTFGEVKNIKQIKFKELKTREYFYENNFLEIEDD